MNPQTGIFAEAPHLHHHLEFDVGGSVGAADLAPAIAGIQADSRVAGLECVIGFGPDLWTRLGGVAPELDPFAEITGIDGKGAPSTQHDLWVWIQGEEIDTIFDLAMNAARRLGGLAELAQEVPCFVYLDRRDMTGFIDGTENPKGAKRADVAVIADGEPGAGGSYVLTMKWVHDLVAFHALPIDEQEDVIGRSKPDSVELEAKPASAHISRVVIERDGAELEIYRRSTPFGTVTEHGLFFVAFSAHPGRFDLMLSRMFGLEDGIRDRLTDFSKPISGSHYFAPSIEALAAI